MVSAPATVIGSVDECNDKRIKKEFLSSCQVKNIVIYRKAFPLGADLSFPSYIKALGKKKFPKYYLRIERIPLTTDYHGTLVFIVPNWEWGLRGPFSDGVLLRDCIIQNLEGENFFTIQASARTTNFLLVSSMLLYAIPLVVFELFMLATNNNVSLTDVSLLIVAAIFILIPLWIYHQDKHFLDLVGSLGTELEQN
jgi:hypothetical protein